MPTLQNRRQKTSLWKSAMRPQRQTLPHLLPLPRKRVRQKSVVVEADSDFEEFSPEDLG